MHCHIAVQLPDFFRSTGKNNGLVNKYSVHHLTLQLEPTVAPGNYAHMATKTTHDVNVARHCFTASAHLTCDRH